MNAETSRDQRCQFHRYSLAVYSAVYLQLYFLHKTGNGQNIETERSFSVDDNNIDAELYELRDTIVEKIVDKTDYLTTDDVNKWLVGVQDEKISLRHTMK